MNFVWRGGGFTGGEGRECEISMALVARLAREKVARGAKCNNMLSENGFPLFSVEIEYLSFSLVFREELHETCNSSIPCNITLSKTERCQDDSKTESLIRCVCLIQKRLSSYYLV